MVSEKYIWSAVKNNSASHIFFLYALWVRVPNPFIYYLKWDTWIICPCFFWKPASTSVINAFVLSTTVRKNTFILNLKT